MIAPLTWVACMNFVWLRSWPVGAHETYIRYTLYHQYDSSAPTGHDHIVVTYQYVITHSSQSSSFLTRALIALSECTYVQCDFGLVDMVNSLDRHPLSYPFESQFLELFGIWVLTYLVSPTLLRLQADRRSPATLHSPSTTKVRKENKISSYLL